MSLFKKLLLVLAMFCSMMLTSCGGGGSMSAGGGIDGTGIMSAGVVSAFGSIVVNGIDFDTSNALLIVKGKEIGAGDEIVEKNLQIGMVVSVEGRIKKDGSAVADRVIYSANVVGPVTIPAGIDPDPDDNEKYVKVLGQTVVINFITNFAGTSFDDIAEDDVVEVSGYRDVDQGDIDGIIRATFVGKPIIPPIDYEVSGFVENLDTDLNAFMINGLEVDFSLIVNNLPQGIPAEDQLVEIEGRPGAGGELVASAIRLGDELDGDDGNEFEIMGFVTDIDSAFEFTIGNQVVIIDENTLVVDELPGGIQLGVKLEAEGVFEGGILFADEIEFWKPDQIEVEGVVDVVDFIGGFPEFTFEEREDQLFLTSEDIGTEFENIAKEDIEPGINLEVKGVPQDSSQNVVTADKVSLEL